MPRGGSIGVGTIVWVLILLAAYQGLPFVLMAGIPAKVHHTTGRDEDDKARAAHKGQENADKQGVPIPFTQSSGTTVPIVVAAVIGRT